MGRNTSISLGNHFEEFINQKVKSGRFNSVSEVVRAGLRLLEDEEMKIQKLREAINEGVQSGFVENYDPKEHLKSLHARVKK